MRTIKAIPSKSAAHRALICAALAENDCAIICNVGSRDIDATRACVSAIKSGSSEMLCGESGSTLRFMLPVMGALGRRGEFFPEGRLAERPISPLYEELIAHGCTLSPKGQVPITIEGKLRSGEYRIPGNVSSQYVSGLLMALPLLAGDSSIAIEGKLESSNYVDLTISVQERFGIEIQHEPSGFKVRGGQRYTAPENFEVEGDWSNSAFWLAAGAIGSEPVCCTGLAAESVQGDRQIADILRQFGAEVEISGDPIKTASVTVSPARLQGTTVDASQIPDLVPVIALTAAVAEGVTRIEGAGRLRFKESDRLNSIRTVLAGLGADIEYSETGDGLVIKGKESLTGGRADSFNDHRIAMMAAVISARCENKVMLTGSEAVSKSYEDFFSDLAALGLDGNLERI